MSRSFFTAAWEHRRGMWTAGLVLSLAVVAVSLGAGEAFAQTTGGTGAFQPVSTAAQSVLTFMTGTFATTAATIAVAAMGFFALTGRIPWNWAFSVIIGIALIFGAAQVVQSLSSGMGTG
ncbi:type IV secretion system protein VirB2 [Rhizobiales bacterium GAS191]|nr:type IV secretion system protein VirB2 [Rhizobiales bacterium GAS188]SEF13290.1 type IV secretion system protein VirB2 [Rhizobiales bacterium GAS191]